ncbi:MAG: S24 family peptidase [Acidiferrobacteraceae bacterium]|jgi:SOS-response transcriptional repressor LexA
MSEGCGDLEPYALQVLGDSMAPEFWDGCVVVIEPARTAPDQSYVIAEASGEVILRQLVHDGDKLLLKPLNDRYPTVEWGPGHTLRGIVVQRAGTRRTHRKHYL